MLADPPAIRAARKPTTTAVARTSPASNVNAAPSATPAPSNGIVATAANRRDQRRSRSAAGATPGAEGDAPTGQWCHSDAVASRSGTARPGRLDRQLGYSLADVAAPRFTGGVSGVCLRPSTSGRLCSASCRRSLGVRRSLSALATRTAFHPPAAPDSGLWHGQRRSRRR